MNRSGGSRTLQPLSASHFSPGVTLKRASSPLRQFPSLLSSDETHVASVRDLMKRSFSRMAAEQSDTRVDRIGKYYTLTAQGLTMTKLGELQRPSAAGGSLASAKPKLGSKRDVGSRARAPRRASVGSAVGVSPVPARKLGFVVAPGMRQPAFAPARPGAAESKEWTFEVEDGSAESSATGHTASAPQLHHQKNTAEFGQNETKTYQQLTPRTRGSVHEEAIQAYWHVVHNVLSNAGISPWNSAWEAGILDRLGITEGPRKLWEDEHGSVLRPTSHLAPPGGNKQDEILAAHAEEMISGATGFDPASMVEEMLHEVEEAYFSAVRQAMLEYQLLSNDPAQHFGLHLYTIDASRFVQKPVFTRQDGGLEMTTIPKRGISFVTRAHITENVLQQLWTLLWKPGAQYHKLRLADVSSQQFISSLPITLKDFAANVDYSVESTMETLNENWRRDATELLAGFIIDLQDDEPDGSGKDSTKDPLSEDLLDFVAAYDYAVKLKTGPAQLGYGLGLRDTLTTRGSVRLSRSGLVSDMGGLITSTPTKKLPPLTEGKSPELRSRSSSVGSHSDFLDHSHDTLYATEVCPPAGRAGGVSFGLNAVKAAELASSKGVLSLSKQWPFRGTQAVARRLRGVFESAAVILSQQLQNIVMDGLDQFRTLLLKYTSPHAVQRGAGSASARAAEKTMPADQHIMPCLRIGLQLTWQQQDATVQVPLPPQFLPPAPLADLGVDAEGIEYVDLTGAPQQGAALAAVWAGPVAIEFSPSADEIKDTLVRSLEHMVTAAQGVERPEIEIEGEEPDDEDVVDGASVGGSSISSRGPKKTKLTSISLGDTRLHEVRQLIERVVDEHMVGPEALLTKYNKFKKIYMAKFKNSMSDVVESDPRVSLKSTQDALEELEKLREDIQGTSNDFVNFGFFSVSTVELKETLCARLQLLVTVLLHQLRTNAMSATRILNARYAFLSAGLLAQPADSAELVQLSEFASRVFDDMALMQKAVYSGVGVGAMLRFLYSEGLLAELQPTTPGSSRANGPGSNLAILSRNAAANATGSQGGAAGIALPLSRSESLQVRDLLMWPDRIRDDLEACRMTLDQEKEGLVASLEAKVADFERRLDSATTAVDRLSTEGSMIHVVELNKKINNMTTTLTDALVESAGLAEQQTRLQLPTADYASRIRMLLENLGPFERLWGSVSTYLDARQQWYHQPVASSNPDMCERAAEGLKVAAIRVAKELPDDAEGPIAVSKKVRGEVELFLTKHMPVLALLANPGLKERHWDEMDSAVGFAIPRQADTPLEGYLRVGLEAHVASIEDTCVNASKEFNLERSLDKMEEEWKPVVLELKPHKDTGTYIVTGMTADEVQLLLDDHIIKSTTMQASRFARPLEGRIKAWIGTLNNVQAVLDEWLKVQGSWLYLEPIFGSEDIMRQMPVEGEKFKTVDVTWRKLMKAAVTDSRAMHAMQQPGMLPKLQETNVLLDQIAKGLNAYLETKRLYFPRFFFLSNDELLEILAETKDPLRVQRHMKKCFEGIAALDFAENLDIMGIISPESEKVAISELVGGGYINPKAANGNVEVWLLQVEENMRRTVARCMDDAIKAYKVAERRSEWAISWSAQSVLGASQMWWTQEVEAAIAAGGAAAVKAYADRCTEQLQDIIMLVRGKLAKLQRKVLSTLMVLDVHSRDVTLKLAEVGIESAYDFEWNSQLRYYWTDDGESARTGRPHSMCMRMINAEIKYAGEYLGAAGRLVITPLTDRCYRTLIGALYLELGGAPEGPAGTGKTETVKDLAKSAGMMCIVYNCSDQLDTAAMAKFFKGLAASGAWACFDEFNRIHLEVLSVVAQQILTIQLAKRANKEQFVFEGTELKLTRTANCFITMNPGYAGRSELPDNLKALFRSVAMMVPDYAMIATIILYSNGYLEAEPMARKIVTTYKLCSEQLSSQDHYDYGMRAVMAVLRAASNLKQKEGEKPEPELILRSIVDVNLPKFLAHDIPLFNGIVSDLFPGVEVTPPDRDDLNRAMHQACQEMGLQPHAYLLEKVLQVYEMMIVRHGFMLVGLPWSGKSTSFKVLSRAMAILLHEEPESEDWQNIIPVVLYPKSVTMGQLYGENDEVTQEWRDGVLSRHFRMCTEAKIGGPKDRTWVTFDGPVDAIWIENMNTVLDDNKKLCLMSGEIIAMSDLMSMVFETQDLAAASPATVSRCGMVYLEPVSVGWRPLLQSWLDHFAEDNPKFPFRAANPNDAEALQRQTDSIAAAAAKAEKQGVPPPEDSRPFSLSKASTDAINRMFELLVDPLLTFIRKGGVVEVLPTQDISLVSSLLAVLECVAAESIQAGQAAADAAGARGKSRDASVGTFQVGAESVKGNRELSADDWVCLFLFACAWSVATIVAESSRTEVHDFVLGVLADPNSITVHPLVAFIKMRGWSADKAQVDDGGLSPACLWPSNGSMYEYWYNVESHKWVSWQNALPKAEIEPSASFSDIIVPTESNLQFNYLVRLLTHYRKQTLVVGPTGTGKSAYMKRLLLKTLPSDQYQPILVSFSARTSANATQSIVDEKLERRRKGVFGPRPGVTSTIFVDDLNMPEPEVYGAQPPLELLRQMADQGGWYDLTELTFKTFEDTMMLAAMGPPDGGRNQISPRIQRHFNTLVFPDFSDTTLAGIFSTITAWHFASPDWASDVTSSQNAVVAATKEVFVEAVANLRPTPAKSHYTFNLRDFARVIQGVTLATPRTVQSASSLARLWTHEACRVFGDRLVDDTDRTWFAALVSRVVRRHFGSDLAALTGHLDAMRTKLGGGGLKVDSLEKGALSKDDLRMILWGRYNDTKGDFGEAQDADELIVSLDECLTEYNATSKKRMDLVMFLFFIEHVSRVARVLAMPGGHALLVGVGGSGRQCAARLATSMAGARLETVELAKSYGNDEWRDDLKRILAEAGTGQGEVVFFFSDTQIKWPGMVEDINNVLNSGEVPNLFGMEDKPEILEKMGGLARQAGMGKDLSPADLWAFFVERCRSNLHIVLAMSPIGEAFRDRLRKFPSLVNCCTVDWFTAWPRDALTAVAVKHLSELDVVKPIDGEPEAAMTHKAALLGSLTNLCREFHRTARERSNEFASQLKRFSYVTPTSYMELLTQFARSLGQQQLKVATARDRYRAGLMQLESATQSVNVLRKQLEDLQPTLVQSQEDTDALMVDIQAKLPGVEETRAVVNTETEAANAEAAIVQGQKDECEADLAEAVPILESALASLDTLTKKDFDTIRAYQKPPDKVKLALEAVCVMLKEKPDRIKDPDGGMKKVEDYWGPAKRLLGDVKTFMARLKDYDKDNIDPGVMAKLRGRYIDDENFDPDVVASASSAAAGLASWCHAMDKYDRVAKVVAPKRIALAEAESQLVVKMSALKEKQDRLAAVEGELGKLQDAFEAANNKKQHLEEEVELTKLKLVRAEQLITGLGGEKTRWTAEAASLQAKYDALTGDVLLSAGVMSYLGAFTIEFRRDTVQQWVDLLCAAGLVVSATPSTGARGAGGAAAGDAKDAGDSDGDGFGDTSVEFSLSKVMGDAIAIRQWQLKGLPTDAFSADNAVIVANARRWPLMIDPQGQANKWVKNMEQRNNLKVVKLTDGNFLRTMENAIQLGLPVCLENVGEELDPALEPVLLKQVFKQGGTPYIRLGDGNVEYDDNFKLYITTKLRNPHYLPEVSTKVSLLNFMITPAGLQDQLLGTVVEQERPDLASEKSRLLVEGAENERALAELEDRILEVLSRDGNILEDETAISVLNESKVLSNEIMQKQAVAAETEKKIDSTRQGYVPVAAHASRLFFCISDMGAVDPMYQYSMGWFNNLFLGSIANSKRSDNLRTRIAALNDHLTFSIYQNVCRSLFERHKLLFSFLLTVRIMQGRGEVDAAEWFFLLTGGVAVGENPLANPGKPWLGDKSWAELCRLSDLKTFTGLKDDVVKNPTGWKAIYDAEMPHHEDLPGQWGALGFLTRLQRILVLRCIRPDKVLAAVQEFVGAAMGEQFLTPPPFNLAASHADSVPAQPLVFVLSPGSDPMAELLAFASSINMRVEPISLGQGQGPKAEALITAARKEGFWVVLQNCHLAVSWMPRLEKICEDLADAAAGTGAAAAEGQLPPHDRFRLWTTSYPSADFPVSMLQNGVKMTLEPPAGLRNNLKRSYLSDPISNPEFFNGVRNGDRFRRMLFGLCFFHALVQERREFGPLGWNIPYEFNESDLRISVQQLAIFLDDTNYCPIPQGQQGSSVQDVPYSALQYLTGQCNYGGRVTDDKDRRTLMSLLTKFYSENIHTPELALAPSKAWQTPPDSTQTYDDYLSFIDSLPAVALPEAFGLHSNANLSKDQRETTAMFDAVLVTERGKGGGGGGSGGSGGKTREETIGDVAADIASKVRQPYDLEAVAARFPVDWSESMNTVLTQELARYNRLLQLVHDSLSSVQKAIHGLVLMSSQLEELGSDLFFGRVPAMWRPRSYPSLKPLGGYVSDLVARLDFFDAWFAHGTPQKFWISGFFFTQSFLTAALQNFARKYTVAIDEVDFNTDMMSGTKDDITSAPGDGAFVHGMFLDGCRWDTVRQSLAESAPKVLFSAAPVMWLKPAHQSKLRVYSHYECPMYVTSERRGILRTTGHSSNYVMMVKMPSEKDQHHWIRRGVALLLQLDD